MKIFLYCYKLYHQMENKINIGNCSYKKRAIYSIIGGFARAGVYLLS